MYTGLAKSILPQMYPVHGAAVAFFRGKFWVFGGSTGNDNYDHTITDKVSLQKALFDRSILLCRIS